MSEFPQCTCKTTLGIDSCLVHGPGARFLKPATKDTEVARLREALQAHEDRSKAVNAKGFDAQWEIVAPWVPRMIELGLTDPYKSPEQNLNFFLGLPRVLRRKALEDHG